jgi:MtrB/PioB family decaheme-associated outer membrane protein
VPRGHPRLEPSGWFDLLAAVEEIIMRAHMIPVAGLVLAFAAAASAQDPPTRSQPVDPVAIGQSGFTGRAYGTVDFGGRFRSVTGDEARYQRYRDLTPGPTASNAIYGRRTEDWTFEARAWNIGYRDQKYTVDYNRVGRLSASFLWDQIPLFISRDTRTLYSETSAGTFRIDDPIQQAIQAASNTLRDFEDQATQFDLRTLRKVSQFDLVFLANRETSLNVKVRSADRDGQIPFGGTFGFNNAVELPVPIETRTTDVQSTLEWSHAKGLLRVGWDGSTFDNSVQTVVWDNPLRYGPDISGTPSQGRQALWPNNSLYYVHGTGAYSLPGRGRVTGYVAFGQGRSNEDLLPFTINTALAPVTLSRTTAEAETQNTVAQATLSMRPVPRFSLSAKYRFSDIDVQTPVFRRDTGSVAYDSTRSATATPSEYHSVRRNSVDVDGAFEVLPFTSLKVGYSLLGSDYTHRIFESTDENVFRVSLDTTGNQYVTVRGLYEDRSRDGDGFNPDALAEVGELATLRHFDVADRDRRRFTLIASVTPGGMFGVNVSAGVGRDEYPNSPNGLRNYDSNQYSVGFDVAPDDDRQSISGAYGWERFNSLQVSRAANNADEQANPLRDWSADYDGDVNYVDLTYTNRFIERTAIRVTLDWTRSKDTYLYGLAPGSPLAVPEQLPPVKNELVRGEVDVAYELTRHIRVGAGYWYDDYYVEDFALGPDTLSGIALPPPNPTNPLAPTNALLLGYQYRPYTAHTGFVRLTYVW